MREDVVTIVASKHVYLLCATRPVDKMVAQYIEMKAALFRTTELWNAIGQPFGQFDQTILASAVRR